MDWHPRMARDLAALDHRLRPETEVPPAVYEVVRRVVYATGDPALLTQLQISRAVLGAGAAALAARCPVVVDSIAIQSALGQSLPRSFANPLYCAAAALARPHWQQPGVVRGMEALVQRCPRGLYVVGESVDALEALVGLIELKQVLPALVVATPPGWGAAAATKERLKATAIPWIMVEGERGGSAIAIAILDALIELTQASRSGV